MTYEEEMKIKRLPMEKRKEYVKECFEKLREAIHITCYAENLGADQMDYRIDEAEFWAIKSLDKSIKEEE